MVRLIIPLYLPSLEGFFEDGLRLFERTLASIEATGSERVRTTVIDNGCTPEVAAALDAHLLNGRIDQVVRNSFNRGRIDPITAELKATFEPIAVVADADVAFRSGWVDSLLAGFTAFPECGLLSLHPAPDLRWLVSTSVLAGAPTSRARIVRAPVLDRADAERFAGSIGRPATEQPAAGQLVVVRGENALMLGFSHFAFAIRREATADLPQQPTLLRRSGVGLEETIDGAGWWCASVLTALVHHMGNVLDDEEHRRIEAFQATEMADLPAPLGPPRQSQISRRLPPLARRALAFAARSIYGRPRVNDVVFPEREILKEPSSAVRVVSK
ncbi:MAG: glycosyltransferase family A protein [Aquihabitans sp.]